MLKQTHETCCAETYADSRAAADRESILAQNELEMDDLSEWSRRYRLAAVAEASATDLQES